jgi:hypothetical protein
MKIPDKIQLRYHHLEFIRYLGTISITDFELGTGMDDFTLDRKILQYWVDNFDEFRNTKVEWVEGADTICLMCSRVDSEKKICVGYSSREIQRYEQRAPEEIRKEVDELAKQAYDVTKLRTIADILLLDGNGLFSKK